MEAMEVRTPAGGQAPRSGRPTVLRRRRQLTTGAGLPGRGEAHAHVPVPGAVPLRHVTPTARLNTAQRSSKRHVHIDHHPPARRARGVREGKSAPLALAVAARVAAQRAGVVEVNRRQADRLERPDLARLACPVEVSIRPYNHPGERRIILIEDAVVIRVEVPQRFEAVLGERPALQPRGRAEELASITDDAVAVANPLKSGQGSGMRCQIAPRLPRLPNMGQMAVDTRLLSLGVLEGLVSQGNETESGKAHPRAQDRCHRSIHVQEQAGPRPDEASQAKLIACLVCGHAPAGASSRASRACVPVEFVQVSLRCRSAPFLVIRL